MLNGQQNGIYRPLVKAAWLKYCADGGRDPADKSLRETWYRKQLLDACGYWTTKQIATAEEFDKVLAHFAILAGDRKMVAWVAESQERRAHWRLRQTMHNAGVDWPYVEGIQRKMGYADKALEDLPAEIVLKINTAVYLHWRRQQKKAAVTA